MERWILVLVIGVTLNLIAGTQQDNVDLEPGSGSGDGRTDDIEGSADETPCERELSDAISSKVPGVFRPNCTPNGEYQPMQCKTNPRVCWCVDKDGKKITGPRKNSENVDCTTPVIIARTIKPHESMPEFVTKKRAEYMSTETDFVIDESAITKMETERTTYRKPPRTQTTTSSDAGYDHSDGSVNAQNKPSSFAFLFKDPLILAGIIGGAVLALLCIVLLIMFTIYRMRKKDEGSYALDEPKKSYGFAYTRARDQEFFA